MASASVPAADTSSKKPDSECAHNPPVSKLRAKFEEAWGVKLQPKRGWHLSDMFEAMEHGHLTTLYVLGENPADSEADRHRALKRLRGLEFLLVQDLFYTKTAELADVVLPAPRAARPSHRAASRRRSRRC